MRPTVAPRGTAFRRRLADPLFNAFAMTILGFALIAVIYPI
jgi:hypothetical protein